MLIYVQGNPVFIRDGVTLESSPLYSGHGVGLNNPDMESVPDVGPIPAGQWSIGEWIEDHPDLGRWAAPLTPVGHDAHGRTAFFIHGDTAEHNKTASHGCIVCGPLGSGGRMAIRDSGETDLLVVADAPS